MVAQLKTVAEFEEAIKYSGLTVIDFYAVWCNPCKMIAPVIDQLAAAYKDVLFFQVDVDRSADVSAEQGITAMPTLLFFKNGVKVGTVVGANVQKIRALVAQNA